MRWATGRNHYPFRVVVLNLQEDLLVYPLLEWMGFSPLGHTRCISAVESRNTDLNPPLGWINYANPRLAARTLCQHLESFNSAISAGPSKGPAGLWSAQGQSCLLVVICLGCHSFLFLAVQPRRQMEMCGCHCGSINGLSFLDRILFNGASPFLAFFPCVWSIWLLKCSDVLTLKYTHREYREFLLITMSRVSEWCLEYSWGGVEWDGPTS